jgi:pyruvate dehydrogenase E1 component alpha subunit
MARMRAFEEGISDLWHRGLVSGELHLGIGEEAIAAGVLAHIRDGDAMAIDYRSTPPLIGRGVDLDLLVHEVLGLESGLCRGHGGHMHLYSPEHLAMSTGIVGSPAPLAAGLALSAMHLRPGCVAVAFFGDGAVNQGMVMEALNLAVVWRLPIVFVCKDNGWAVTTRSSRLTGGTIAGRARAFGMPASSVDGRDVRAVWKTAGAAVERGRRGGGPTFIVARCSRPRGHFENDPLVRAVRQPRELATMLPELMRRSAETEAGPGARFRTLAGLARTLLRAAFDQVVLRWDPLRRAAHRLPAATARAMAEEARLEVGESIARALRELPS